MNTTEIKRMMLKRRLRIIDDQARFDKLPPSEQRRLTDNGLNPYEKPATRKAKQARVRAEIDAHISKLPKEARDKLKTLGVYHKGDGTIIRRTTGNIKTK